MFKRICYQIVEKGAHGKRRYLAFDNLIILLIVLSVISITLESIPDINPIFRKFLQYFDAFTIMVFTLEYFMRIYVSDLTHPSKNRFRSAVRFMFSFQGLIDLIAILPFYIPMIVRIDLRYVRIVRLARFLRILKVNRYNNSINLIHEVIREKRSELATTVFLAFHVIVVASFLMHHFEGVVQPDKFSNVLDSFWWAIATLTTIGYGDVYPVTAIGKIMSGVIAIVGIGLVALPTGIISAGFINKVEKKKNANTVCPHCKKEIHPNDESN